MKKETKKAPTIRFRGFTDNWEQRKVGEFYDFKNGLNKNKEFFGTGVPIVNFTDVFHNRGLTASQLEGRVTLEPNEIKNYRVKKGDIFFTRTSETIEEIGYPSVMLDTPENTVFSGFVLRGRCFSSNDPLDNLFKQYVFFTQSFRDEMKKKSSMTTRALTSGTSIKEMLFQFPSSKNEQHQIGKCITKFDDLITLHQRKLDQLKALKKYFLQNMFPAKGEKVPRIRFKGFTGDWEQHKLGELVIIERGGSPRPIDAYITEAQDGLNWVKIGDAPEQGRYITHTKEKIKPSGLSKTRQVFPGDLILSNSMSFGKPYIMGITGCIHDGWLLIRNNQNVFDLKFLCQMLGTEQMFAQYRRLAAGSTVNNLNKELVANAIVKVPETTEQEQIGAFLENLDNVITLHQRKLDQLQTMKKFMLQNLFI